MKTSELTGTALDWAVAKCEGVTFGLWSGAVVDEFSNPMMYHDDWSMGGPIIERECICIARLDPQEDEFGNRSNDFWVAHIDGIYCRYGVSAIVAAMRCYVASKLGDEVELPEGI